MPNGAVLLVTGGEFREFDTMMAYSAVLEAEVKAQRWAALGYALRCMRSAGRLVGCIEVSEAGVAVREADSSRGTVGHLGEWRALWSKAGAVAARCCPDDKFKTREEREAFEFLRTALVYQRNALDAFDPIRLHEQMRPHERAKTNNTLLRLNEPLFRVLSNSDYKATAGPFLASASVRVSVGVLATIRINRATFPDTPIKGIDVDWKRAEIEQRAFGPIPVLGHCADGPLGSTRDEVLGNAGVIVLVHRDNFGHGEVGVGDPYRQRREAMLDSLYICRLLEAQRVLIRWSLDEFS